uniref:Uncharacterized protein n=1 Tax=Leersia perrieri TaxID=77586 RepID=A0A0D9Y0A8_9ORYZ
MGLLNVIIETDSSEVRRVVVEKGRDRSIYATQIKELKQKLRLGDSTLPLPLTGGGGGGFAWRPVAENSRRIQLLNAEKATAEGTTPQRM